MSNQSTITMKYKGKTASIKLSWDKTPFEDCKAEFKGDSTVLGAYHHQVKGKLGYFIRQPTLNNAETHLNAVYSASTFFDGFTFSVSPEIDLDKHLDDENKKEGRVY